LTVQAEAEGATESERLKKSPETHQKLAQEGYQAFHNDKELSKTTWGQLCMHS